MNKNKKEYYQGIINELIESHGEEKFTYRLFGERMNSSKQRAKQVVDNFKLVVPSRDYFGSAECADLRELIQSNEIFQYTLQELQEDRYKKFLPHAFIRALVYSSGKAFSNRTTQGLYTEFFSKTKTDEKSKDELFAEFQAMFPEKEHNYSSFCSDINKRRIVFRRKRKESFGRKNENAKIRREAFSSLIESFLSESTIDSFLYAMNQLYVLYEEFAKNSNTTSIEYRYFKKVASFDKIPLAQSKPAALLNRLISLGVDLKTLDLKEISILHNAQYPQFPATPKMLNDYLIKSHLGRH